MYIYSLIVNVCRRPRSSLPVWYFTIPYLEINTCSRMAVHYWSVVFYPPTTGDPDVEKPRSHAPRYDTYVPLWTDISRRSILIFFIPVVRCIRFLCLLCCCRSFAPATVSPFAENYSSFSYNFTKVRQVSPSSAFRFFCCFVVVVALLQLPAFLHSRVMPFSAST